MPGIMRIARRWTDSLVSVDAETGMSHRVRIFQKTDLITLTLHSLRPTRHVIPDTSWVISVKCVTSVCVCASEHRAVSAAELEKLQTTHLHSS